MDLREKVRKELGLRWDEENNVLWITKETDSGFDSLWALPEEAKFEVLDAIKGGKGGDE